MKNEWQKLNEYFRDNRSAQITQDPTDQNVFEDPRDKSNIVSINLLPRTGIPQQKLEAAAKRIQTLLDDHKIAGFACCVEGAKDHKGIRIVAEQPLPKALGIRSEFDGVPVGFSMVESIAAMMQNSLPVKASSKRRP